jgi:hypothetical protein
VKAPATSAASAIAAAQKQPATAAMKQSKATKQPKVPRQDSYSLALAPCPAKPAFAPGKHPGGRGISPSRGCLRIDPSQFGRAPTVKSRAIATKGALRAAAASSPLSICPAAPDGKVYYKRSEVCTYDPLTFNDNFDYDGVTYAVDVAFDVEMWTELSPVNQSWTTEVQVTPTAVASDPPGVVTGNVTMTCTDPGCSPSAQNGAMPFVEGEMQTASYGFLESVPSGPTSMVNLDNKLSFGFSTDDIPAPGASSMGFAGVGKPDPIRCDNTNNNSGYTNGGCVMRYFDPIWVVSDGMYPTLGLVAKHMAMATGNLPGYAGLAGLPGVYPNSPLTFRPDLHDANYARACGSVSPPPAEVLAGNTSCDEYPFASTFQGAANPSVPYSICWVPSEANSSQGGVFKDFNNENRVLNGDDFFVDATYDGNQPGCGAGSGAGGAASVTSDQAWNDEFQSYGDTSGGWSGGDGAQSALLPDGNSAWFFGDTYLGGISPDGTHGPLSTGGAHNSSVVYNASSGTLGPVNAGAPGSGGYLWNGDYTWVYPPSAYPATQYELLNGDQVFDNGTLYKFYQLADRGLSPGGFQYKLVGTVLQAFSVSGDTLTPGGQVSIGVQDSAGSNPTLWGTAVLAPGDGYIYIYGTQPYNTQTAGPDAYPLYLARVPVGDLSAGTADWQYYDGSPGCDPPASAWSSSASAATQLMPGGTSSGFSVTDVNDTYVLLTNNSLSPSTYNHAVAYYADCPTGFSASSPMYPVYTPSVPNGYLTYEYRIVPQFSNGDNVVISYSEDTERVDGSCMLENFYDSSIYRPRFLDVTLPDLVGGGGAVSDPPDHAPPAYSAPVVSPDPMYTPTDTYPGTSTATSQFCSANATPLNSPSLTLTSNSNDVIGLSWSLQPTAMWMYSVVYCDETYWAAQGKACPANLVGPQGNALTQAIPACSNQVASTSDCGFNLSFGDTSSTVAYLNYGDTYEIQVETCLSVLGGQYVGSNVVTAKAS